MEKKKKKTTSTYMYLTMLIATHTREKKTTYMY